MTTELRCPKDNTLLATFEDTKDGTGFHMRTGADNILIKKGWTERPGHMAVLFICPNCLTEVPGMEMPNGTT